MTTLVLVERTLHGGRRRGRDNVWGATRHSTSIENMYPCQVRRNNNASERWVQHVYVLWAVQPRICAVEPCWSIAHVYQAR